MPPARRLCLVALASLPLACTIPPGAADAGGGGAATETVADQCNAIATAYCQHVTGDCLVFESLADCIANETPTCCSGSTCQSLSATSPVTVSSCASAIAAQECNTAVNVGVRGIAVCQGIPRPQ